MITDELKAQINRLSGTADLRDLTLLLPPFFEGGAPDALKFLTDTLLPLTMTDEKSAPRILRLRDFLEQTSDPPPGICEGFLPSKKLIVLGGAPKEGKSLIALELLHCVSEGRRILQKFDLVEPGPVVYFGMEDGAVEIKKRLLKRGVSDVDLPLYICTDRFDLATVTGRAWFDKLVKSLPVPPTLVVVDTVRKAFPTVPNWNDAAYVGPAIAPFCDWAHDNCTVILIHHTNKNPLAEGVNKFSGSNALPSSCDDWMILEGQRRLENGDLQWSFEMDGRSGVQWKHMIEMDTNTLHIRLLDSGEIEEARRQKSFDERTEFYHKVAKYLDSAGASAVKSIADVIGVKYNFCTTLLREMKTAGHVEKTSETVTAPGAGRPAPLYTITQAGRDNYLLGGTYRGRSEQTNNSEHSNGSAPSTETGISEEPDLDDVDEV